MADKLVKKGSSKKHDDDIASVAGGINFDDREQAQTGPVVSTSSGSYIGGNVSIGGGTFVGRDQHSAAEFDLARMDQVFRLAAEAIRTRPDTGEDLKHDLQAEVADLEAHFRDRGSAPDEAFVARHVRNIARMAPDILDVMLTALTSPLGGYGLSLKRLAEKARGQASDSG